MMPSVCHFRPQKEQLIYDSKCAHCPSSVLNEQAILSQQEEGQVEKKRSRKVKSSEIKKQLVDWMKNIYIFRR